MKLKWMQKSALLLAGVLALSGTSQARWVNWAEPVPTERLIENVSEFVEKNPQDAHGHYILGRVHSLAFARGTETLAVIPAEKQEEDSRHKGLPDFSSHISLQVKRELKDTSPASIAHLNQSVAHYLVATQLDFDNALYLLGLGWMLEQGAPFVPQARVENMFPMVKIDAKTAAQHQLRIAQLGSRDNAESLRAYRQLREKLLVVGRKLMEVSIDEKQPVAVKAKAESLLVLFWQQKSLSAYRRAYSFRVQEELAATGTFPHGDEPISVEAGQGVIRLLVAIKNDKLSQGEALEKAGIEKTIKAINSKPRAVTPILIPFGEKTELSEMLAPDKIVRFDLAGDARGAKWSWVQADTGILVWDPQNTGKITSGRQLFGSATWWMFFNDGYEALRTLDDNSNGWIEGAETKGLAIWRDANGNGISDKGEVLPLRQTGVEALAVQAEQGAAGVLQNAQGARMKGGATRPTYDWIAEPQAF